jgi:hypothetical protein
MAISYLYFGIPPPTVDCPKPCRNAKFISQFGFLGILLSCAKLEFRVGARRGTPTLFHQGKIVAISAPTFSC